MHVDPCARASDLKHRVFAAARAWLRRRREDEMIATRATLIVYKPGVRRVSIVEIDIERSSIYAVKCVAEIDSSGGYQLYTVDDVDGNESARRIKELYL